MKITKGPDELSFTPWVGKSCKCFGCGCTFTLELKDKPAINMYPSGSLDMVSFMSSVDPVPCPLCGTKCLPEGASTLASEMIRADRVAKARRRWVDITERP